MLTQNQDLFQNYLQEQHSIQLENARKIIDASFITNVALAGNTNVAVNTVSFNLIQSYAGSEHYRAEFDIDPAATVPSTSTVTVNLQDSADNSTFAAISGVAAVVLTGNTSNVIPAANLAVVYSLPTITRQFVRGVVTVGAIGASPTGNVVFSLRF